MCMFINVFKMEMTAVKMALKLKEKNNMNKAKKLFQHALFLNPNHHDTLLHYGEFLESSKDIIGADHFYLKATISGPKNSKAVEHRKRTLPLVNRLDNEELKRIDLKRARLNPSRSKEIRFQYIHHTVAIEGNTMNLAETRHVIETKLAVGGKSILEHNEILGVDDALSYLNQLSGNICVRDVLEIHKRVLGRVDPTIAGTFRKIQVFVGGYEPPAASDVETLMNEFVKTLNSNVVKNMHPIHIAAFAHYKLAFIHPFVDGNGRTSRLLMNLILFRYGYPLVIIKKEEMSQYFKHLQTAHEGDIRPFYRFIARCTENTIDLLTND